MSKSLREIWENAYISKGNETSGVIATNYNSHENIADYNINNDILIVSIGKNYSDNEEKEIELIEIEEIIRNSFEGLGLNRNFKIKFDFLK